MKESEKQAEELLQLLGRELSKSRAKQMEPDSELPASPLTEAKKESPIPSERSSVLTCTGKARGKRHFKQICAALLCCILLAAAVTTVSSEAFRAKVFGFFFDDKDGYTDLIPAEDSAFGEFFYPEYLPEGYQLVSDEDIGEAGRDLIFENAEKEDFIVLTQFNDNHLGLSFDTEKTIKESCLVGECEGWYFHSGNDNEGDTHTLIWERDGIFLELSATLSKEEMLKIGASLKYKK